MHTSQIILFSTANENISVDVRLENETIWANKKQMAQIFGVDRSVISRHIKNILTDEELNEKEVCAFFAHTTEHGSIKGKTQTRTLDFYNLDMILSVGYRVNSKTATNFRKWATKTLNTHITQGFTINSAQVEKNHQKFLQAVENIKILTQQNPNIASSDVLELIKTFSGTWFSLDAYDRDQLPKTGVTQKELIMQSSDLYESIAMLKKELMEKKEATSLFAQEKQKGNLGGILGNVFQNVFGQELYESVEEKAAHLLYFIIKNHPFDDGNKRTGAFCFVWILQKSGYNFQKKITPQTLTALTLLIAESNPKEKERMIGLVLLFLHYENK